MQLGNVRDRYLQLMPNTEISLGVLRGDVNGDGTVNVSDALVTRGRSGSGLDPLTFRADVNRDGSINSGDSIAVRSQSGTGLTLAAEQGFEKSARSQ